jgi:hypothetical protein
MPNGARYINSLLGVFPTKAATSALSLSAAQAVSLEGILRTDANDHFYSACASLVDAIRGLDSGFYTWATVKCYYSVFYSLRALLAMDGVCILYVPRSDNKISEYWIQSAAGSKLVTEPGWRGTHKLTLNVFGRQNPGHRLLSNPIENLSPTSWLIDKREESNYRRSRFSEPEAPDHFRYVESDGVRSLLVAYIDDDAYMYTFQKDHAMLAFPLAALIHTGKTLQANGGAGIENHELLFLTTKCRDRQGQISRLVSLFRELAK